MLIRQYHHRDVYSSQVDLVYDILKLEFLIVWALKGVVIKNVKRNILDMEIRLVNL